MAKSDNPQVASLAAIVLDVARVKPYKTRRLKFLAQKHPELLGKVAEHGFDSGLANGKKKNPQTAVSHSCAHELGVRSRFGSGDLELRILVIHQYGVGSKPFIGPVSPWTWAVDHTSQGVIALTESRGLRTDNSCVSIPAPQNRLSKT